MLRTLTLLRLVPIFSLPPTLGDGTADAAHRHRKSSTACLRAEGTSVGTCAEGSLLIVRFDFVQILK